MYYFLLKKFKKIERLQGLVTSILKKRYDLIFPSGIDESTNN